jgi:hypothetical protein
MDFVAFERAKVFFESLPARYNELSSKIYDIRLQFSNSVQGGVVDGIRMMAAMNANGQPLPAICRVFQVEPWAIDVSSWNRYVAAVDEVVNHFIGGFDLEILASLNCADQYCGCPLSSSPIGERGGVPRRVPCRRQDFHQFEYYETFTAQHVSSENLFMHHCIRNEASNILTSFFPHLSCTG